MSRYRFTVLASLDLEEIYDQIAADNSNAALKLINAIEERCNGLADMPNQGGSRNELFPGMRSVTVGSYIISISHLVAVFWSFGCSTLRETVVNYFWMIPCRLN